MSYQFFDELPEETYLALKASIAEHGVQVPVEIDQHGTIIDGNHRVRAWSELRAEGVKLPDYPRQIQEFRSEADRIAHAIELNVTRRQLRRSERRRVALRLAREGMSTRWIASKLGVDHSTIVRDLAAHRRRGGALAPPSQEADVEKEPAPRQRAKLTVYSTRDQRRATEALAALGDETPRRPHHLRRLEQAARDAEVAKDPEPDGSSVSGATWQVECCRFQDWELEEASVDLIVTDPPYPKRHVDLFDDLGRFAARVLKDGRLLITYAPKMWLPAVHEHLGAHLTYVHLGSIHQPGKLSRIQATKVLGGHRPFLIYAKGPYVPRGWIHDAILSPTPPSKAEHRWEQAVDPVAQLIREASKPAELVCDPMVGSGTTGVAAIREGRSFLGAERNPRFARLASETIRAAADAYVA